MPLYGNPGSSNATNVTYNGSHVDTLVVDTSGLGPADSGMPGIKTGKGLCFAPPMYSSSPQKPTEAELRCVPIWIPGSIAFSEIGVVLTTVGSANSKIRLGIYGDDGSGAYPGALILDAGTVATIATPGAKAIAISQTLTQGWYWLGAAVQGAATPTVAEYRCYSNAFPNVGMNSGNKTGETFGVPICCYYQAGVTAALPSNFTTTVNVNIYPPRVYLLAT